MSTWRTVFFVIVAAGLAAMGGFLYVHRHHLTARGVVRSALSDMPRDGIVDLFVESPPAVRHIFDWKNCVNNHGEMPQHGYRIMALTSRPPTTRDLQEYAKPGFSPDVMVDAQIYDPYLRRTVISRYPCIRIGHWWYIMDTWISTPPE